MNPTKEEMAQIINREKMSGTLSDAIQGADVFVGVSVVGALTWKMARSMASDAIVFAMTNPILEIMPKVY